MTTGGEGGLLTTNDPDLWARLWSIKDHGKSYHAVHAKDHKPGFRWLHESFGSNFRMTEMQSAIGRIQLRRMASWTRLRNERARRIRQAARHCAVLRVPSEICGPSCGPAGCGECVHAYYRCYLFVETQKLAPGWSRDRLVSEISGRGVPCFSGSCPEVYLERAFDGTPWRPGHRLSAARELGETSLAFLVHPTLTDAELDRTCEVLRAVCREAAAG